MDMDSQQEPMSDSKTPLKTPVVRGARACTVCRAAKMKCVGAEDGQKKCQRCKRANAECIFEKHRRGRKPGSKLSEASKMLRRLEKGLNSAKMKSQSADPSRPSAYPGDSRSAGPSHDSLYSRRSADVEYSQGRSHFPSNEMPPLNVYSSPDGYPASSAGSRTMDPDDDDEDLDKNEEAIFPVKMIKKENERNSFFRTILNPPESPSARPAATNQSFSPPQPHAATIPTGLNDPITAGIITEDDAKVLFDLVFLRLNPFICLFDPALHSVRYVRSRCPFLFTALIMAGCKFFKPEKFKACQKLANEFALRAFAEGWKRVEVVQAFACLTYWQDPDDNRSWTYIGYACRMAVELGLNRYVAHLPANESEHQRLERRNNERTYLVLFVHDRSLSTQHGRHWMLPEDEFIRHSTTWHQDGGGSIRAEDVIIAAFVQLRRFVTETTERFHESKNNMHGNGGDTNIEAIVRKCNASLSEWDITWSREMERINGTKFHFSILSFFRLYTKLFLNSFGVHSSMASGSCQSPSLQALSACCASALDSLRVVSRDFVSMSMLSYGQDSVTVMTAYAAVFLLKLIRMPSTSAHIDENTTREIQDVISQTADAYEDASSISPASTNAAYHARFLRNLVANRDIFKPRRSSMPIDPRLQAPASTHGAMHSPQVYSHHGQPIQSHMQQQQQQQTFHFVAPPHAQGQTHYHSDMSMRTNMGNSAPPPVTYTSNFVPQVPHDTEQDAHYWKNIFQEIGFGEGEINNQAHGSAASVNHARHQFVDQHQSQQYHSRFSSYQTQPYSPPNYGQ